LAIFMLLSFNKSAARRSPAGGLHWQSQFYFSKRGNGFFNTWL